MVLYVGSTAMEPTWISLFAILLLEMFSYFLKAVHMMRILHLELVLALESMIIKYFGFFMQDARIKAYLINVRNIHQGVDPGNA